MIALPKIQYPAYTIKANGTPSNKPNGLLVE
jgi:hypothetical protein